MYQMSHSLQKWLNLIINLKIYINLIIETLFQLSHSQIVFSIKISKLVTKFFAMSGALDTFGYSDVSDN